MYLILMEMAKILRSQDLLENKAWRTHKVNLFFKRGNKRNGCQPMLLHV